MSAFTIRAATVDDIPQMLVNAEAFLNVIGIIDFNAESMRATLAECIDAELCFVAVDHVGLHLGGVGAIATPLPMDELTLACVERFLWMTPGDRGKGVGLQLLGTLRNAAVKVGCHRLIMVALENDSLPLVEKFYLRFGLVPRERTYEMRL
jgi:GNAT superfamily N-acetyltransferase